jgi:sec-independent protein translocase protein TatA
MPSVGWPELLIVLVIALVIFGPKRLPDMGRQLGRGLREFRKATSEIQDHFDLSLDDKNEDKDARTEAQPAATTSVPFTETVASSAPLTETEATSLPPTEAPSAAPAEASAVEAPDVVDGEVLHEETEHPAHTATG